MSETPVRDRDVWAQCKRCDTHFGVPRYQQHDPPELCTVCTAIEDEEGRGDA